MTDALPWSELLAEPGARRDSTACPSTTRCTCCSPRAPPGCRRPSCTATAGSCSSTSRRRPSTSTSAPATARCGSPPPRGRCGTSGCPRCCGGPPSWSSTATRCFPDLLQQWRIAAEAGVTLLGTSPAYLMSCRAAGIEPARVGDLSAPADAGHHRLAAARRGFRLGRRAVRRPGAGQLDQRRHGRLLRRSWRATRGSRCTAASCPGRASASTSPRSTRRATRSSARSASW